MNWWNRLLTWLGISEPQGRKEQVEDWIVAHEADIVILRNWVANHRGALSGLAGEQWYPRIDRLEKFFGANIPTWAGVEVNVYEAPTQHSPKHTRMGYSLTFYVTEADGSVWTLTLEPGADKTPEWVEVTRVDIR